MLEVGIHHDHRPAARMLETGAQRFLVTEIAGEGNIADLRICSGGGADRGQRAVGGAVVHKYDFVTAERLQDALERLSHRRDIAGLVKGRKHH